MRELDAELRVRELRANGYVGAPDAALLAFKARGESVRRAVDLMYAKPVLTGWPDDCDW